MIPAFSNALVFAEMRASGSIGRVNPAAHGALGVDRGGARDPAGDQRSRALVHADAPL